MNAIQNTLIERDGLTEAEAVDVMNATREEVYDAIYGGDFDLAEDIFTGDLGLEMDYIFDLLF